MQENEECRGLAANYCDILGKSTRTAIKPSITSGTSSPHSPSPSILPDFVNGSSLKFSSLSTGQMIVPGYIGFQANTIERDRVMAPFHTVSKSHRDIG